MSDPRDDLAALIAKWKWGKDLDYHEAIEGVRYDEWDDLGPAYQREVIAPNYEEADAILAAGYVKPKPPTVTPDHDIDAISSHLCAACGNSIEWDDNTEEWVH